MAIEQDVVIVGRRNKDHKLHLANHNAKFAVKEFNDVDAAIHIDPTVHDWTNYFLCGFKVWQIL